VYRTGIGCLRGKVKDSFEVSKRRICSNKIGFIQASPGAQIDEEKIHGGIKQCFGTAKEEG
jgi:hypothetical protein